MLMPSVFISKQLFRKETTEERGKADAKSAT